MRLLPVMEWFPIFMGLFGGLALFLFGMETMADGLKAVAGSRMKQVLKRLTGNRLMGVTTGAFVTAVIQSSSVTTVLVVGFISAGLMTLTQSVGVIMGANIGTTITAQVIAFKVTKYALLLVAVGYGISFVSRKKWDNHGRLVMGLGLIFLGMMLMGEAMKPLRSHEPFIAWMAEMETPGFAIMAGAAFTAIVQSSSATTAVVILLAQQGVVDLSGGIGLCLGANIGTCITALIAALGRPREALRAALIHVMFNTIGVLIWVGLIDQLVILAEAISPSHQHLSGAEQVAAETPRRIANAHTVFNVINALVLLPFAGLFARFVSWAVKDRPSKLEAEVKAKYLDSNLLDTPSFALDHARLEILHMGNRVKRMLDQAHTIVLSGNKHELDRLEAMDNEIDILHGTVVEYLGKISQRTLPEDLTNELVQLFEAVNSLESIGDLIERNLVPLGRSRVNDNVTISKGTLKVLGGVHRSVLRAYETALLAVTQRNSEAGDLVLSMKRDIKGMAEEARHHEMRRLIAEEPNRVMAYSIETDYVEHLMQIFYFCRRMARVGR